MSFAARTCRIVLSICGLALVQSGGAVAGQNPAAQEAPVRGKLSGLQER